MHVIKIRVYTLHNKLGKVTGRVRAGQVRSEQGRVRVRFRANVMVGQDGRVRSVMGNGTRAGYGRLTEDRVGQC